MKRIETDLLGEPLPSSAAFRLDGRRRKVGYDAKPGTGPKRQFCRTCLHAENVLRDGHRSLKCGWKAHAWTHTSETNIVPNSPACREWERRPFTADTIKVK